MVQPLAVEGLEGIWWSSKEEIGLNSHPKLQLVLSTNHSFLASSQYMHMLYIALSVNSRYDTDYNWVPTSLCGRGHV